MLKSKIVVALAASIGLVATSLLGATSASAAGGSNAGGAVASDRSYATPAANPGACAQIMKPADYPPGTKLVDLTTTADFTIVDKKNGVTFAPPMEKRTVGVTWASWGSPPATESATPHILFSAGATSEVLTFPKRGRKTVGVEVEPNPYASHTFTAVLKGRAGATLCTITRNAHGNAGARLLAATATAKVKKMTISSDVDFAIAQVRSKKL